MHTLSLTVSELACARGGSPVFAGVSFGLKAGGLLTVRGANGSGKSSLLRILARLMKPSAGSLSFDLGGAAVPAEEIAQSSHLVGHSGELTDAMTAEENLQFQIKLLGGDFSKLSGALKRVGLEAQPSKPARMLSAGQRRRLALARLIAVPRPLWLLDEPTEALDAAGEALVSALIEEHRSSGGLVIVATHARSLPAPGTELTLIPATRRAA